MYLGEVEVKQQVVIIAPTCGSGKFTKVFEDNRHRRKRRSKGARAEKMVK